MLEQNIAIQQAIVTVGEDRLRAGRTTTVNVEQVRSNLLQNQAQVEQLHVGLRLAANRLCVLLGVPPQDMEQRLGTQPIPVAPPEVLVGIPADLLRRRPDVRRAERQAAAQAEQIGIAVTELYPAITINGTLGYQAREFAELFLQSSFYRKRRAIVPMESVELRPAAEQRPPAGGAVAGGDRVLPTDRSFGQRRSGKRADHLPSCPTAGQVAGRQRHRRPKTAVLTIQKQLQVGVIDFNQYAVIQQNLIQQQDLWAQARGEIALGLIQAYRASGGGWEIRLPEAADYEESALPEEVPPPAAEQP